MVDVTILVLRMVQKLNVVVMKDMNSTRMERHATKVSNVIVVSRHFYLFEFLSKGETTLDTFRTD